MYSILHSVFRSIKNCAMISPIEPKRRENMSTAQICIMATIIVYLCLVIFTGVMIGRRSKKSAEGFYLGGRGIGPLVTAMSAEASDMSSYLLMGIPGLA